MAMCHHAAPGQGRSLSSSITRRVQGVTEMAALAECGREAGRWLEQSVAMTPTSINARALLFSRHLSCK